MKNETKLTLILSACVALCGCFDSDEVLPPDPQNGSETATDELNEAAGLPELSPPLSNIPDGALWGACRIGDDGQEINGWGCDGAVGEWTACLRPVSEEPLSLCVPQTWDDAVAEDCVGLPPPGFGLGVDVVGSAYCAPRCVTDADCLAVQRCSPASHFCAWLGE